MPVAPCRSRTRASSCATSRSATSHPTSTKGSSPRFARSLASRSRSQPSRTAGRATRKPEWTIAGIAASIGDGAGSRAKGSQRSTRPSSTTAVKAPQWTSDGKRPGSGIDAPI